MSLLIHSDVVDIDGELHLWRVMMVSDEYICDRDAQTLKTRDRDTAVRFLAGSLDADALRRAQNFLTSVAPLQFTRAVDQGSEGS